MSNAFLIIRTLLIYSICLPLAIFLGYQLATPDDMGTITTLMFVMSILLLPVVLRWHHAWLIASWNLSVQLFFLPGNLQWFIVMAAVSFTVAIFQRALNKKMQFLWNASLIAPVVCLVGVILMTAELTGGIGFRASGSELYGGKRYLMLLGALLGLVALVSRPIPSERAKWYFALFFLPGLTAGISNLAPLLNPSFYIIYYIFPVDTTGLVTNDIVADTSGTRLQGVSNAGLCLFLFLLGYYGIARLLNLRRCWRLGLLLAAAAAAMLGGYRSIMIVMVLTFSFLFCFEGLLRTRWLPILGVCAILLAVVVLPFATKLPFPIQRALSFLPIEIDPVPAADAQYSSEWRVRIWQRVLPEIPHYLLLGKGYSINPRDVELVKTADSADVAFLSGDYHNGPLSVIVPFGLWGGVAFIWFLIASFRIVRRNYINSPPELKTINNFLFAYFCAKLVFFFFVFGSLYTDMCVYTSIVGLSISFNNGVREPAPVKEPVTTVPRLRFARAQ